MHQIVALWTHPRSLSTALERVVIERGDFEVIHEPFSVVYYQHEQRAAAVHSELAEDLPVDYTSVRNRILKAAESRPVFFKDMCYHCCEHLERDPAFLKRTRNVFLIRDPGPAIASHFAMNPDVTVDEIGYEKQAMVFEMARAIDRTIPLVLNAECLQRNPAETLRLLWEFAEVADCPEALQWQAGHRAEWDTWKAWHADAASSTHIAPRKTSYPDTVDNNSVLRGFDNHHRPFYEALHQHCRRIPADIKRTDDDAV